MKVAKREEMKEIDRLASRDYLIPSVILMENAGEAVIRRLKKFLPNFDKLKYTVFCGIGNNGGDGAVIARKLFLMGISVKVYFVGKLSDAKGDAKTNFEILQNLSIPYDQIQRVEDWAKIQFLVRSSDVFIDAIFGIGFHGEASPLFQSIAHFLNELKRISPDKTILAVDLPSGLYADLGISSSVIRADLTLTFGLPKPGLLDFPGKDFVGKLYVDSINLPPALLQNHKLKLNIPTLSDLRNRLPHRPQNSHKGNFGHLLVIGGKNGMIGAPLFCAESAERAGCGKVSLALPKSLQATAQSYDPSIMVVPYESEKDILSFIRENSIQHIVIGNGLGQNETSLRILSAVLSLETKALILDADALNLISREENLQNTLKNLNYPVLLTPHLGEMSRLINKSVKEIKNFKIDYSRQLAKELNVFLLLKDAVSVFSDSDQSWILDDGNSTLAKGGSGDILAGLIAGLLSTGSSVEDSVLIANFLLGTSAKIYSARKDCFSARPQDLLSLIPKAWEILLDPKIKNFSQIQIREVEK